MEQLLERARLSPADQRLILVGSRYSLGFDEIAESMHMAVCRRDGQPILKKGDGKSSGRFGYGSSSTTAASSSSSSSTKGSFNGKGDGRRVYITEHQDGTLSDVPEEGGDGQGGR